MSKKPIHIELSLLNYKDQLTSKTLDGTTYLLDPVRKKWIILTPEELVRQLTLLYLLEKAEPYKRLLSVEKVINVNGRIKRFDILLYDSEAKPKLLVECKNPKVPITNETFNQIAQYNIALKVPTLMVTNGNETYCCSIDFNSREFSFLDEVRLF
ncbi:MAG: type I restriction enzyme HsdR N-terminal domain-containing protein [Bacteroidia bacterium]|nr:type I restriction enzyme HsdR N-terminal domain-containing protein [Bacteroidia bacterium]